MVDHDVFDQRLTRLGELIRDLQQLAAGDRESFLADRRLQTMAERWLQLAVEACLDLANHLIATREWPTPTTYREAFSTLAAKGVLSAELAAKMESWAGLRNVLVHLYLNIDHRRLWATLTEDLGDIEAYIAALTQELNR